MPPISRACSTGQRGYQHHEVPIMTLFSLGATSLPSCHLLWPSWIPVREDFGTGPELLFMALGTGRPH